MQASRRGRLPKGSSGIMRRMAHSRRSQAYRHPRRFQRRLLRRLSRYSRLVIVLVVTAAAAFLGDNLEARATIGSERGL